MLSSLFAHVPIALALQAAGYAVGRLFGAPPVAAAWSGAFAAAAACVMREVTQAEYRYIEAHGHLRRLMPDYEGTKIWAWNAHSIEETIGAVAAVALVAAIVTVAAGRAPAR